MKKTYEELPKVGSHGKQPLNRDGGGGGGGDGLFEHLIHAMNRC